MSHLFFKLEEVELLPCGVVPLPAVGPLVLGRSPAAGLTIGDGGALRAVDVPPVAATADHHLAMAPSAVVEASSLDHRRQAAIELDKPRWPSDCPRRGHRCDHRDDSRRLGPRSRASTLSTAPVLPQNWLLAPPHSVDEAGGRSTGPAPSPAWRAARRWHGLFHCSRQTRIAALRIGGLPALIAIMLRIYPAADSRFR